MLIRRSHGSCCAERPPRSVSVSQAAGVTRNDDIVAGSSVPQAASEVPDENGTCCLTGIESAILYAGSLRLPVAHFAEYRVTPLTRASSS